MNENYDHAEYFLYTYSRMLSLQSHVSNVEENKTVLIVIKFQKIRYVEQIIILSYD